MFFENQPTQLNTTQLNFDEYNRRWHNLNPFDPKCKDAYNEFVKYWNMGCFNNYVTSKLATDTGLFAEICKLQRCDYNLTRMFDDQTLSNAAEQHISTISGLHPATDAAFAFYKVLEELRYCKREHMSCRFELLRAKLTQLAEGFLNNPLTSERNFPYNRSPNANKVTAQDILFESIHVNSREEFIEFCRGLADAPHSEQSAPQLQ